MTAKKVFLQSEIIKSVKFSTSVLLIIPVVQIHTRVSSKYLLKPKKTPFGYAVGLEKGLYNHNRVVFDTTLRCKNYIFDRNQRISGCVGFRFQISDAKNSKVQISDVNSKDKEHLIC